MREDKKQYQQIENYIKNPHFRKKQQQAIFFILNQIELINQELTGKYKRDIIDSVVSRTKSAESVKKKLIRKGLPVDIKHVEERLHDQTGVRISCTFLDDVYRMLLEQLLPVVHVWMISSVLLIILLQNVIITLDFLKPIFLK